MRYVDGHGNESDKYLDPDSLCSALCLAIATQSRLEQILDRPKADEAKGARIALTALYQQILEANYDVILPRYAIKDHRSEAKDQKEPSSVKHYIYEGWDGSLKGVSE